MKKFFVVSLFFISITGFTQVSVNTANPQGVFHVDGGNDNGISGIPTPAQQANDFVVKSNGSVGIGTTSPDASALLEINTDHLTSKKGVLPPKVQLQNETDNNTIINPANGLMVYHTGATLQGKGLYINQGSPASPLWSLLVTKNSWSDSQITKMKYIGNPDPAKTISVGLLEFRAVDAGGDIKWEVRMTKAPVENINYLSSNLRWLENTIDTSEVSVNFTFTPANWNQWQTYMVMMYSIHPINKADSYNIYFSSLKDPNFYELLLHWRYGITENPSNRFLNVVGAVY